jgi:hypothetical protein
VNFIKTDNIPAENLAFNWLYMSQMAYAKIR